MRALLRRLLETTARKVNRSAAGSFPPAGVDDPAPRGPTAHERTLMRRRLRSLRRAASSSADADAERAALENALERMSTLDELLAGGTSQRCPACGELAGKRDRSCPSCGAQLAAPREAVTRPLGRAQHAPPAAPVRGASSGRSPTPPAR